MNKQIYLFLYFLFHRLTATLEFLLFYNHLTYKDLRPKNVMVSKKILSKRMLVVLKKANLLLLSTQLLEEVHQQHHQFSRQASQDKATSATVTTPSPKDKRSQRMHNFQ